MDQRINIAELLKGCPKGTKLYSPLCGECYFDGLNMGTIICKKQNTQEITFTSNGYYMLPVFDDCECMIFPSKDQRDWSKFEPPYLFNDGDIVATTNGLFVGIVEVKNNMPVGAYCSIDYAEDFRINSDYVFDRLATTWEKARLFQAIKDNGYRWNAETKTLEKFTPDKFDTTTLKPFDKVLVRDNNTQKWTADLFSFFDKSLVYPYSCVGHYTNQCIPYEGNEHLLGTDNDCADYYKNW